MFIILYRWKIKFENEKKFIEGWTEVTDYFLKNCNSLGSRLHRGNDGIFYAYAQWKSAENREKAFADNFSLEGSTKMKESIEESFEPIFLEPIVDFLIIPKKL